MDKKITSIEIQNMSWNMRKETDIVAEVLKIYRTGDIVHFQYNMHSEVVNEYNYKGAEVERFFELLTTKIKVQDWENDYKVKTRDGCAWECKIRHSDNSIKQVNGTVELPPRGEELKELIYKLTDYKVKPWVL